MELITRLWKNFKAQPEIWFFYGFLLTFTLTVRKVLWFFPLRGEFNEYSGIYLYLSDIFLVLTLAAWIITILYNKIDTLSMFKNVPPQKQENCSTWNNFLLRSRRGTIVYIILPLILVMWSFISLIWAENKIVAIFRSAKILEFYLLYIFVLVRFFFWNTNNDISSQKECSTLAPCCENVPCGTFSQFTEWNILRKTFGLIIIIGLLQAIIGIIQFILQHSIGLFWLKESLIAPDIAGVAKVIFNGETFIRVYGLFPHPNILGGFLLFSILISIFYKRMFHPPRVDDASPRVEAGVEQLIKMSLWIQLLALILTFSKSAIIGLILGLVYYVYINVPPQKGCSMWNILRGRHGTIIDFLKKKKRLIIATGLIIIFSFIIAKPDLYSFLFKGLNERSVYVNVSPARIAIQSIAGGRGTIEDLKTFIFGVGNSQFVISMENLPIIKENWMLEPVHNVFLLVWNELGFIGLLILILFILYVLRMCYSRRNVPPQKQENCSTPEGMFHVEHPTGQAWNNFLLRGKRGTIKNVKNTFGAIFMGLLFIMFFDHYLWDIQQGSFLLWITIGFLLGAGKIGGNLTK